MLNRLTLDNGRDDVSNRPSTAYCSDDPDGDTEVLQGENATIQGENAEFGRQHAQIVEDLTEVEALGNVSAFGKPVLCRKNVLSLTLKKLVNCAEERSAKAVPSAPPFI